jgi:Mg-chelatase subunit ChlD
VDDDRGGARKGAQAVSILDKLVRNARQAVRESVRLERHAAEHTSLDEWVLDDLLRDSRDFRDALHAPIDLGDGKVYEPSADIHEDIFLTAHTPGESRALPSQEVRASHRFGRDVLDKFVKTDAHRESKPYTDGDELASAIYARAAIDELDKLMREQDARDQVEQSQDLHEQEQAIDGVQGQIDDLRGEAQQAAQAGQPAPAGVGERMKELIAEREKLLDGYEAMGAHDAPGPLPTSVQGHVETAAQAAQEKVELWGTIAGSGAVDLTHTTPDDAWTLAQAWEQIPDYEEFCKLLGRIQRDFRAQDARKVIGGDDNVIGVELGNNLMRTLPSELAQLGHPQLQRKFIKDYIDETLLQFETEGSEKVSNGPAVLCIDMSGSMGGRKALEAKAVAVGFVRLMHKKNRDAVVLCFNGAVIWQHHFAKRHTLDMNALLALASLQPNGGTNITKAVERAEHYTTKAPVFRRADVLIVTDGQSGWTAVAGQVRDRFQKAGVRSHGIAIGHTPAEGGWLLNFCDDAISVAALTEATGDIVRAVA